MSASSPRRLAGAAVPVCPGEAGRRVKNAAAMMKLSASSAMAHPPPTPTTNSPPAVGPRILAPFCAAASSELARCVSSRATSSGITPRSAGEVNASIAPYATDKAAMAARL
jgi:hypothetical protein